MNISESINQLGIAVVLKSIFPNTKGIDFNQVKFNSDFDKSGFSSIKSSHDWFFSIGSMPILYKHSSTESIDNELEKLIIRNDINIKSSYKVSASSDNTLWDGNGFKIEKVIDKDNLYLIIITSVSSITKNSIVYNESKLAKKVSPPNWISGFNYVYDSNSISNNDKNLSNFDLSPLIFKDENDYILIPINRSEYARPLIEKIIENNGGLDSFNSDQQNGWKDLYLGHLFVIGYTPEQKCIRINRKPTSAESDEDKDFSSGIHPLSIIINKQVKGLNKQVFNPADGSVADGRLVALNDEANNIVAFDEDASKLISKFKDVVNQYNQRDPFLSINESSIKIWMDKNPVENISFSVPNSFELILSKGDSLYRLNIFPPGGILGSWSKDYTEITLEKSPTVNFSKEIVTKKAVSSIRSKSTKEKESINATDLKKADFIKSQVIEEDNTDNNQTKKTSNSSAIIKWILIIVGIIILFLLLRNCSANRNAEYYYNRGVDNVGSREFEKAEKDFGRAIDMDNSIVKPYIDRGEMYLNNEEYQKAKNDLDQAILLDPKSWYAFYLRGLANMNMATSKYSRLNDSAIKDFSSSIELNPSSENGKSFYQRGKVYQFTDNDEFCSDYYQACEYKTLDACRIVDESCYPKTGFMPYNKHFGPGIFGGRNSYTIDNQLGEEDVVVSLIKIPSERRVRAQFIRKGEKLVIDNIPNGKYKIRLFSGNNWSNSLKMKDEITKGGFLNDVLFEEIDGYDELYNGSERTLVLNVNDGNTESEKITESEFFN